MNKPKSPFTRLNSAPYLLTRRCSRELLLELLHTNASTSPHLASSSSMPILRRSQSGKVSARQVRPYAGLSSTDNNSRMNLSGPNAEFDSTLAVIISNLSSSTTPASAATSGTTCTTSANNNTPTPLPQHKPNPKPAPVHYDAKANIKYKNEAGRAAVLAVSKTVHYDFGQLNNICNVTLPIEELDALAENPDIEWVDRNGAVFFMQPYRSSK